MKYIFPTLIFLILAIPPSDCFNPSFSPSVLYLCGGTHAMLLALLPPTIYPNPHAWEKPSASAVCLDSIAANGFAAPERVTDTEL